MRHINCALIATAVLLLLVVIYKCCQTKEQFTFLDNQINSNEVYDETDVPLPLITSEAYYNRYYCNQGNPYNDGDYDFIGANYDQFLSTTNRIRSKIIPRKLVKAEEQIVMPINYVA
jgi:hypothetical protein